jgi:hypothetical protein
MSINVENLTKLINHLKLVNKKNFDMSEWYEDDEDKWLEKPATELVWYIQQGKGDCGTVACIAGHAAILEAAERNITLEDMGNAEYTAMDWLGLNYDQAHRLFKPGLTPDGRWWAGSLGQLRNHTLQKAIAVLERLKETAESGKPSINWSTPIKKRENPNAY